MSAGDRAQRLLTQYLTSERFETLRRQGAEAYRRLRGAEHEVEFFHDPGDPWSYLLLQALAPFRERFEVKLTCRTVSAPGANWVGDLHQQRAYAHEDCRLLASWYGLHGPERIPSPDEVLTVAAELASREQEGDYIKHALHLGADLFRGTSLSGTMNASSEQLERNRARLQQLGHYAGGMLYYANEWFWGVDRLMILEERLSGLGLGAGHTLEEHPDAMPALDERELDFFFSFRSPYSFLSLGRLFELTSEFDLDLRLRPVLPMVERGVPLPRAKTLYIVLDAGREARRHHVPFGRILDPLGEGVNNCLAVFAELGDDEDRKRQFLHSAMNGIWARGIDVSTPDGIEMVSNEAGISQREVARALSRKHRGQELARANRELLEGSDLWGVPSMVIGPHRLWGQDRLPLLRAMLAQSSAHIGA